MSWFLARPSGVFAFGLHEDSSRQLASFTSHPGPDRAAQTLAFVVEVDIVPAWSLSPPRYREGET